MNFLFATVALVFAAGMTPRPAFADATAIAFVGDALSPQLDPPAVTDPVEATMSGFAPGQSAFALSNQSTGILRVRGEAGPYTDFSTASAYFIDTVTFSGGVGQTAYLDYSFDGSLTNLGPADFTSAYGIFGVLAANIGGTESTSETLSGYGCGFDTNCQAGTSIARTGSLGFTIYNGPTTIIASLGASSSYGNTFDFGNTAKIYLRTPDGVSFSSADGFLSAAAPIGSAVVTPVPEPGSSALMMAGLTLIGTVAHRRRHRDTADWLGRQPTLPRPFRCAEQVTCVV